jgi:hypothetical protein
MEGQDELMHGRFGQDQHATCGICLLMCMNSSHDKMQESTTLTAVNRQLRPACQIQAFIQLYEDLLSGFQAPTSLLTPTQLSNTPFC